MPTELDAEITEIVAALNEFGTDYSFYEVDRAHTGSTGAVVETPVGDPFVIKGSPPEIVRTYNQGVVGAGSKSPDTRLSTTIAGDQDGFVPRQGMIVERNGRQHRVVAVTQIDLGDTIGAWTVELSS